MLTQLDRVFHVHHRQRIRAGGQDGSRDLHKPKAIRVGLEGGEDTRVWASHLARQTCVVGYGPEVDLKTVRAAQSLILSKRHRDSCAVLQLDNRMLNRLTSRASASGPGDVSAYGGSHLGGESSQLGFHVALEPEDECVHPVLEG
jgi:hypothetical protein